MNTNTTTRRPHYGSPPTVASPINNHHHYAQTISRSSNLNPNQYNNHYNTGMFPHHPHAHPQQQHRLSTSNQYYYASSLQNSHNNKTPASEINYHYQPAASMTLGAQERNQLMLQRRQLQQQEASLMGVLERQGMLNRPLCRCRVMYLGSSVPHITKNGLHGIQEPLRHLYPEEQFRTSKFGMSTRPNMPPTSPNGTGTVDISHLSSSLGIDSWLSVWSNGLLLENVDEFGREIKRFFSIESLHYCAAVRYFDTSTLASGVSSSPSSSSYGSSTLAQTTHPLLEQTKHHHHQQQQQQQRTSNSSSIDQQDQNNNNLLDSNSPTTSSAETATAAMETPSNTNEILLNHQPPPQRKGVVRFLPLDAPLFQCPGMIDAKHPPVFASIMRRTTGIKVLECHAFICRRDAASNALVRCCTQAYADLLSAKRLSVELSMNYASNQYHSNQRHSFNYENQENHQNRRASGSLLSTTMKLDNNDDYQSIEHSLSSMNGNRRQKHHSSITSNSSSSVMGDNSAAKTSRRKKTSSGSSQKKESELANRSNNYDNVAYDNSSSGAEDNYAIITKSNNKDKKEKDNASIGSRHSKQQQQQQKKLRRREKGSSKSLYDDFMPQYCDKECCVNSTSSKDNKKRNRISDTSKLSHSLDLLRLENNNKNNNRNSNSWFDNNNNDSCCGQGNDNCDDLICYSIVKRHSKSMQNLDNKGTYEFTCPSMKGHERRTTTGTTFGKQHRTPRSSISKGSSSGGERVRRQHNRKHHHHSSNGRDSIRSSSSKISTTRAHSYQDMRLSGNRYSEMSFQEDKARFLPNDHKLTIKDNKESLDCSKTNSYATVHRESQQQRAPCCPPLEATTPRKSSHNNKSSSSSKQSSKRRHSVDPASNSQTPQQQQQQQQQQHQQQGSTGTTTTNYYPHQQFPHYQQLNNVNNHYQQPANLYSPSAHSNAYYQQAPGYMAPLPLGPHQPAVQYPPGPIYPMHHPMHPRTHHPAGSIYAPCPTSAAAAPGYVDPSMLYPQHSNSSSHYMVAGHPAAALLPYGCVPAHPSLYGPVQLPPSAMQQQQQQQAGGKNKNIYANGSANTISAGRSKGKENNNKTSLATRFRCLSPPLNFLSGSSNGTNSKQQQQNNTKSNGKPKEADEAKANVVDDTVGSQSKQQQQQEPGAQSSTPRLDSADSSSLVSVDGTKIISGQPAFTSSGPASAALLKQQQQQQTNKKMSWIKRLSLTMGSVNLSHHESQQIGETPQADDSSATELSTSGQSPNGEPASGPAPRHPNKIKQDASEKEQTRKKRSSIFSGSLTLSRTKQHAKLITT